MLLRQKLFPLSIIRTAKCDKKEWPAKGYWANRWTGPKSSLPVPQWTGPLSVGACAENGSPFPSLHQSSAAPPNFADCDFPSKHHFLFYTVDSCRCSLQLQNVWPCNDEVCEAQNLLLKPHSDFRKLRKIQADSQMRTSDYSFVIYKYLHSVGTTTPTLVLSGEEVTRLLLPLTSKPEQVPVQPRAHWLTVKRTPGSTLWPFEPLCSRKRGKKWQRQNWEHGDKCCQVRTSKHLPC